VGRAKVAQTDACRRRRSSGQPLRMADIRAADHRQNSLPHRRRRTDAAPTGRSASRSAALWI